MCKNTILKTLLIGCVAFCSLSAQAEVDAIEAARQAKAAAEKAAATAAAATDAAIEAAAAKAAKDARADAKQAKQDKAAREAAEAAAAEEAELDATAAAAAKIIIFYTVFVWNPFNIIKHPPDLIASAGSRLCFKLFGKILRIIRSNLPML